MKKTALQTRPIQSLDRGLFLLEAVAQSTDPVPLGELTDRLGIDRSSVFRLAYTLKRRGFLANPNGRKDYVLGPSIWRLSQKYNWSKALVSLCHDRLKALAEATGETTHLAIREGRQALFIDHYAPTRQIVVVSGQAGEFAPLHCTAHGKALLPDFGIEELRAIFGSQPFQRYTARTIVSIAQLAKACARIKADGYALDDREMLPEVRCLAAPIRDESAAVIASIGISAPQVRFPKARYQEAIRQVCDAAGEINAMLANKTATK
ncbi:MAG TPA: IclR family transcriptional regulator [Bryobacteraceae bacterium]|nr:IclR family transcriptional regulator [Bryobacteraceae bacterium]